MPTTTFTLLALLGAADCLSLTVLAVRKAAPKERHCSIAREHTDFWPYQSFAKRAPMFVFVFAASLLQLTFHSPASAALFQLPPTFGKYSR